MPEIKAFYREDRLILLTGSLVVAGAQADTWLPVMGKSTMTIAKAYCYGNMSGYFPAELKKAEFNGVVSDFFTYLLQRLDYDMLVLDMNKNPARSSGQGDLCQYTLLRTPRFFYSARHLIYLPSSL